MPPISSVIMAGLSGGAIGLLLTGCPTPSCPQCSLKNANFTIQRADARIVDVVMHSSGEFKEHCPGQDGKTGCTKSDKKSLGVLPEGKLQRFPLPWESAPEDIIEVTIDVLREAPGGGTTIQLPRPTVTISG